MLIEPGRDFWPVVSDLLRAGDDIAEVDRIVREHRLTRGEFRFLDEKPGRFGYTINGKEWHYKLRRWRNSPMFKVWFAENNA